MIERERLLDIKEAARFLNVSETSLRRWTNSGRLVCLRIGRRRERRFRQSDLLAFMERDPSANGVGFPGTPQPSGHTTVAGEPMPYGTHLCGMYSTDEDRVRLAVEFLAGGLASDDACYVFATDRARATILNGLEDRESTLATHIERGRLVASDYAPSAAAQLDLVRTHIAAALQAGARSIRLVGDMIGFAARVGSRGVVEYENAYSTTIARRFPVVTLCQYDARYFGGVDLVGALRSHPDSFRYPARVL